MPLWIFLLIAAVAAAIILGPWLVRTARAWAYDWRHAQHVIAQAQAGPAEPSFRGSMNYYDEYPERARHFPPREEWNRSSAETDGGWEHRTALYNGHTWGCLVPDTDHLGACPEEGDWPDDRWPVPFLPAAGPVAAGPDVLDAVLALEAEDPAAAGWTDQLLADLRDAPTVLDAPTIYHTQSVRCLSCGWRGIGQPADECSECDTPTVLDGGLAGTCDWGDCNEPANGWRDDLPVCARHGIYTTELERLADTGEIHMAGLHADWDAELAAQDDDAAEFISRQASAAAEYRLQIHGL